MLRPCIPLLIVVLASLPSQGADFANLPLIFEENPSGSQYPYMTRASGFTLFFGAGEALIQDVRIRFGKGAQPEPTAKLSSVSNYYLGADPASWRTQRPHYGQIRYRNTFPGIDLVYYGNGRRVEFDFIVAPGADPRAIRLELEGARRLRLDGGDLIVETGEGTIRMQKPVVYQEIDGERKPVAGAFKISGKHEVAFRVGRYDPEHQLVIDPVLSYSTYVGGSGLESATAIAVDATNSVVIAGSTTSVNFPATAGAYQPAASLNSDIFVAKLNAAGTALVYATYIGGTGIDHAYDVALDSAGNAYITGYTTGAFPTTPGAYQAPSGSTEVVVTKLAASGGGLVYSTVLGIGTGYGIAVGSMGNAYVVGHAPGAFPTTAGTLQANPAGGGDAFVTQLNSTGTGLLYSTLIGAVDLDMARAVAVNGSGEATVVGQTMKGSVAFPTTPGAFQRTARGSFDAFITRLNAAGTGFVYSTLLGGHGEDLPYGVAVDSAGHTYVTGYTNDFIYSAGDNAPFPTTSGAFQTLQPTRGFLTKLNPSGTGLIYSTYLGSTTSAFCSDPLSRQCGSGFAVAVDSAGRAHVAGGAPGNYYYGPGLQITAGAVQSTPGGASDVFLLQFDPTGSSVSYGTFLGGAGEDSASDVAVDAAGNVYLAGLTESSNFPTATGSMDRTWNGQTDAFIARIQMAAQVCSYALSETSQGFPAAGGSRSFTLTAPAGCSWTASVNNASWITLTSATSGAGSAAVSFSVANNTTAIPRSGTMTAGGQTYTVSQAAAACTYTIIPSSLGFGRTGGTNSVYVDTLQGCAWNASSPAAWITLASSPNGIGPANVLFNVAVNPGATRSATLSIAGKTVAVTQAGPDARAPYGHVDVPANNSTGVVGAIAVSGWALDDVEVTKIEVWRDPVAGEGSALIYIGNGVFLDGARPDVQSANPGVPYNSRAGWGMLVLTNMLPGRGNGTYRLHVFAYDAAGNRTVLAIRSIICTNATAAKPFGTLDTPDSGGTASGAAFPNFGWALTPQPAVIPQDASTIWVFVDGQPLGHPVYNQYRPDIASLFPGYANSNGAIGAFIVNTTTMANGLHSIAWSVTDNLGRTEGIGSRLFTVSNISTSVEKPAALSKRASAVHSVNTTLTVRTGHDPAAPLRPVDEEPIRVEQGGRVELHLPGRVARGCLMVDDECRSLPVGSILTNGIFYWQIEPAYFGSYQLKFEGAAEPVVIRVEVQRN
jgi:hypothetical protein